MSNSTKPPPTDPRPCSRHDWMNFRGWYDAANDKYLRSCHDVQCPRHGVGACRRMYHRKKKALKPDWGFVTFIIFFNSKPDPDEVREYRKLVRKAVKSWDRDARICMPLHPKDGKWHLNVGVQSKWVFEMSNLHWWGQYVEERVVGWSDGKRMRYPRGAPRRADFESMMKRLEAGITELCARDRLNSPRRPRIERGKFHNQPNRWLWYILRCKAGWSEDEQLPRRQGYTLVTGFVSRAKNTAPSTLASSDATTTASQHTTDPEPEQTEAAESFTATESYRPAAESPNLMSPDHGRDGRRTSVARGPPATS